MKNMWILSLAVVVKMITNRMRRQKEVQPAETSEWNHTVCPIQMFCCFQMETWQKDKILPVFCCFCVENYLKTLEWTQCFHLNVDTLDCIINVTELMEGLIHRDYSQMWFVIFVATERGNLQDDAGWYRFWKELMSLNLIRAPLIHWFIIWDRCWWEQARRRQVRGRAGETDGDQETRKWKRSRTREACMWVMGHFQHTYEAV